MSIDVSIIIAAYNIEHYIERAVDSALSQVGVNIEVIIIDDCSTDGTWKLISSFSDPRIKCLQTPQNSGPSIARNMGIKAASGRWISILDGDDAFVEGRLSRCLVRAQAQNADIIIDNITVLLEDSGDKFPMFSSDKFASYNLIDLPMFIRGKISRFDKYSLGYLKPIFSAKFLRDHNIFYDEGIKIGEDYLLFAEALANGAICAVEPSQGYIYTARTGSISHRLSPDNARLMIEGDMRLQGRVPFDSAAMKQQKRRTRKLKGFHAFSLLVEAIKRKSLKDSLRIILKRPSSLLYLRQPIWARIKIKSK